MGVATRASGLTGPQPGVAGGLGGGGKPGFCRGPEAHLGNLRRYVEGFLEEAMLGNRMLGPEAEGEGGAGVRQGHSRGQSRGKEEQVEWGSQRGHGRLSRAAGIPKARLRGETAGEGGG